jgi:hypothetical protein
LALEVYFNAHYAAPLTALNIALVVQAMRHLRLWEWEGKPAGLFLVRAVPVIGLAVLAVRLLALGFHSPLGRAYAWMIELGPGERGLERALIQAKLDRMPGRHLVMVRYAANHDPKREVEWVYNAADIDAAKVVWAREMDPASNARLVAYFKGRRVWLVEPDKRPVQLEACLITAPP